MADSCADEHSRISPWPRSLARTAPYRAATRVPAPPTSHSVPPLPPQPLCSAGRAHLSAACSCAHLLRHRENTSLRHCHLSRSSAVGRPDKSPSSAAPPTVPSFGRGSKRRGCTQRGQAGNGGAPSRRSFFAQGSKGVPPVTPQLWAGPNTFLRLGYGQRRCSRRSPDTTATSLCRDLRRQSLARAG